MAQRFEPLRCVANRFDDLALDLEFLVASQRRHRAYQPARIDNFDRTPVGKFRDHRTDQVREFFFQFNWLRQQRAAIGKEALDLFDPGERADIGERDHPSEWFAVRGRERVGADQDLDRRQIRPTQNCADAAQGLALAGDSGNRRRIPSALMANSAQRESVVKLPQQRILPA